MLDALRVIVSICTSETAKEDIISLLIADGRHGVI